MPLPDRIQIKIANETLTLDKVIQAGGQLSGLSDKQIYQDKNGKRYFVKLQKPRTPEVIFEASSKNVKEKQAEKYLQEKHVKELQDNYSFLEILGPSIVKKIFGKNSDLISVPHNYLCIQQDKTKGESATLVLSKELPGFKEFLSQRPIVKGKQKPSDWTASPLPKRSQLNLNPKEAKALGKLLGVALLMGHLDMLNNINLSNSGMVQNEKGEWVPAIVDWGNTMGQGFGGLSVEENAFKNLDLMLRKGVIDPNNINISDFQHCVPFDEVVYPLLPRQLVKDLFNMDGKDPISRNILQGFSQVCDQAMASVKNIDEQVRSATQEALDQYTNSADREYIKHILNQSVYFPNQKETAENSDKYNLTNVIRARIHSLMDIKHRLEAGESLEQIAQTRLMQILESQKVLSAPAPLSAPMVEPQKVLSTPAISPLLFSSSPQVAKTAIESPHSSPSSSRPASPNPMRERTDSSSSLDSLASSNTSPLNSLASSAAAPTASKASSFSEPSSPAPSKPGSPSPNAGSLSPKAGSPNPSSKTSKANMSASVKGASVKSTSEEDEPPPLTLPPSRRKKL